MLYLLIFFVSMIIQFKQEQFEHFCENNYADYIDLTLFLSSFTSLTTIRAQRIRLEAPRVAKYM